MIRYFRSVTKVMKEGVEGMAMKKQDWAIYVRVSTVEQADKGVSLDAQQARCREYLQANKHRVSEVYCDAGISAKNLKRPALQTLMQDAEGGRIAGVVVMKLDRLSRSVSDLIELAELFSLWGVPLKSVSEDFDTGTAMGRMIFNVMGSVAQMERERIGERVKESFHHIKSKGGYTGSACPIGLKAVGKKGERQLVEDEACSYIVKEAWTIVLKGGSLMNVIEHFNEHGLKTKRGAAWSKQRISALLKRERYIGLLVSQSTFDKVQETLRNRFNPLNTDGGKVHRSEGKQKRVWLLRGIAYCQKCNSRLYCTYQGRGRRPYFRCTGRMQKGVIFCDAPNIPAEAYEKAAVEAVVQEVTSGGRVSRFLAEHIRGYRKRSAPQLAQRPDLEKERDLVSQQIEVILDLVVQGGGAADAARPRLESLQSQKEGVMRKLDDLAMVERSLEVEEADVPRIMRGLKTIAQNMLMLPPEQKRSVLLGLVKEVFIERNASLDITLSIPTEFQVNNVGLSPETVHPPSSPMVGTLVSIGTDERT